MDHPERLPPCRSADGRADLPRGGRYRNQSEQLGEGAMIEAQSANHTLELPRRFYEDHIDRCEELHKNHVLIEKAWKSATVVIEACDKALDELESDADYWGTMSPSYVGKEYFGLIRSAAAALKRIKTYRAARGPMLT